MKLIITSDTHKNREDIEKAVKFAKAKNIDTIIDCGDLHGEIDAFSGVKLHAVYWREASGAMDQWEFNSEVKAIGGEVHSNGSVFKIGDTAVYIQHNLADYMKQIPAKALAKAKGALDVLVEQEGRAMEKLVLFGHTHNFHFNSEDGLLALNPGSLGNGDIPGFIILDTENKSIEYRTVESTVLKIDAQNNTDVVQIRNVDLHNKGKSVSYVARLNNGKEVLVFDGKRTEECEAIPEVESIIDKVNETSSVMFKIKVDGKEAWRTFDKIETPAYSKIVNTPMMIGGVPYIIAEEDGIQTLVKGWAGSHTELMQYKQIYDFTIKMSGDTLAVMAIDADGKQLINCGGIESQRYDSVTLQALHGDKPVFIAKNGLEEFVVVGDQELKHFANKEKYSSVIGCLAMVGDTPAYSVTLDGQQVVYHGSIQVAGPFVAKDKYLSPVKAIAEADGAVALLVQKDGKNIVQVDGKEILLKGSFDDFIASYKKSE